MRKLKLSVEDLEVVSFAVTTSPGSDGTVHGRVEGGTPIPIYDPPSDGNCATGPTNPVCIGPTYCCNPTANTTCCPGVTYACPPTPGNPETCWDSCPYEFCGA